jgi:L-ascorbate metabolism protein UlaG (beta-lactamase superfamily)
MPASEDRSPPVHLTHLGHACLLVETPTARLLLDPGVLSQFDGARDLDAILVTHQHADHVDPARLGPLLAANPGARLLVDADTVTTVPGLPDHTVVRPGDRLTLAGVTIEVVGGRHADVYADVPGCTNAGYLLDDGALLHPGDSFALPGREVDVLAVPIDGPWLKLAEAIGYVHAVRPRVAVPIHEGETTDPAKYAGMLAAFSPPGVVQPLARNERTSL